MTDPVDILLARLEGVRKSGEGWLARCPSHKDRSASLSIGRGNDGRVLLNCFAGCEAIKVVEAAGLSLADLFPERIRSEDTPEDRRRARAHVKLHGWGAALPVLEFESRLVLLAAQDIAAGMTLDEADLQRLGVAIDRINHCRGELQPDDWRRVIRELAAKAMARYDAERAGEVATA